MHDVREHPIRLKYAHVGTRPPVYIAASFTSPPWEPLEMESAPAPSGQDASAGETELEFFKDFYVTEGHWQYKFRLGPGDWWVCNESVATELDEAGNYNNVLIVQPWLTPGAHEEKRAHVRPLAPKDLGDVHDTAWEVTTRADGHKATAAETTNGPMPLVVDSVDRPKPTESSNESDNYEASRSDSVKPIADDQTPAAEPRGNEPSPLFAHECLTPEHEEAEVYLHDPDETGTGTAGETRILDECELEMFPTDREHILQRIQTTKICLDEDETSLNGIPSPTSMPPEVLVDSIPSSGQCSPELGSIKEEDSSDTALSPTLDDSEPVRNGEGSKAFGAVSNSSEAKEATTLEDPCPSDHSTAGEQQTRPVDALKQVLHPGLAALGPRHQSIEQLSNPQTDAQYPSPGVDGAADLVLISSVTPKSHAKAFAASQVPEMTRRQSVPGTFEEFEADVDHVSHIQTKTVENVHGRSGEPDDGSHKRKEPGNRDVTPSTVFGPGRKYDSLLQAFWRIIIVDWLGAILARFSWKSGERK